MPYQEATPAQALRQYEEGAVVLDVRTLPEWGERHIPGAVHIPLDELPDRYQELDPARETLVICQHGVRSDYAGQWLAQMGFEQVYNVRSGMSRWEGPVEAGAGSGTGRASGSESEKRGEQER
jgi:rhodanese-related sulfurtransferase